MIMKNRVGGGRGAFRTKSRKVWGLLFVYLYEHMPVAGGVQTSEEGGGGIAEDGDNGK